MTPTCWFADLPDAGPCEGRLVRCHLIPVSVLKRELAVKSQSCEHCAAPSGEPCRSSKGNPISRSHRSYHMARQRAWKAVLWDSRSWVPGCGGALGPGGHHGQYAPDGPRPIPRHLLPPGLIEFADELALGWWIERTYGPLEAAA